MKRVFPLLLCVFIVAMASCQVAGPKTADFSSPVAGEVKPWTNLKFRNDSADFQFMVIADRTGACRKGVFAKACDRVNLLQPEFVMCIGDLINGSTTDKKVLKTEWDEFDGIVKKLEMPFFYIAGNHDIGNPVMAEIWGSRYGPEYYHFVYKNVLFLCLCTEDQRPGNISDTQVEYVQKTLKANKDVRWTFIFMHQPLYQGLGEKWKAIETALGERQHTVFAGHCHSYSMFKKANGTYIRMATTGGGSPLQGPRAGTFDHVAWVTVTPKGPRIANLMLNGIYGEDVKKEAQPPAPPAK